MDKTSLCAIVWSSSIVLRGSNNRPPSTLLKTPPVGLPEPPFTQPAKTPTVKKRIVIKKYFIYN